MLQSQIQGPVATEVLTEDLRTDPDVGGKIKGRTHASKRVKTFRVNNGKHLHQTLRSTLALRLRIEARLHGNDCKQQERINLQLTPDLKGLLDNRASERRGGGVHTADVLLQA